MPADRFLVERKITPTRGQGIKTAFAARFVVEAQQPSVISEATTLHHLTFLCKYDQVERTAYRPSLHPQPHHIPHRTTRHTPRCLTALNRTPFCSVSVSSSCPPCSTPLSITKMSLSTHSRSPCRFAKHQYPASGVLTAFSEAR